MFDFDNFEEKVKVAPIQQIKDNRVVLKKAGRPTEPTKKPYIFKVDTALHKGLSIKATKMGMNKSAALNMLIAKWLEN